MRYTLKFRNTTLLVAGALFLGLAVHNVLGQQAERVDHFQAPAFDEDAIKAMVFQLARKLSEGDQGVKGLIITYTTPTATGRCRDDATLLDKRVEIAVRDAFSKLPDEISDRIKFRNDDMSRVYQAAFWIIRDGSAEPPVQESGYKPYCPVCPLMRIRRTFEKATNDGKIEFEAVIDRVCSEDRMNWIVSGGKIISGLGSQKILVDISNATEPTLTVTFNLSPWRPECSACPHEVSLTTEIN